MQRDSQTARWWRQDRDGRWYTSVDAESWEPVGLPPPPPLSDVLPVDVAVFEAVTEHLRHDLRMSWEHAALFTLIQGALLSVLAGVAGDDGVVEVETLNVLSGSGAVLAVYWGVVAWSRKRLIGRWRQEVRAVDFAIDRFQTYIHVEDWVAGGPLRGPVKLVSFLPWFIVVGWAVLWAALR